MATIVKDLGNYLQAGEALSANDAVYINSADNKVYKFDVTNGAQVFAGFAKKAAILDDYVFIVQSGSIKGFVGLTPGAFVYASTTAPGSFQLVAPVDSQKVVYGIAKSATELTINGGLGIKPGGSGSGGGGLDVYYTEDMEGLANTSTFATGNNATFLGGGTLQGTLAVESASPISGTKSLKFTQAAGSLNDYFASPVIDLDLKQRDETSGMTLYFTYDGNDNDMKFVVWDVTNGVELSNQVSFVKLASSATRYSLAFYVPASCTQIRWGAQVLVANSGKVLLVDDVEMSTDPFHEGEITNLTDWVSYTPTGSWSTNTTYTGRYRRVGNMMEGEVTVALSGPPNSAVLTVGIPSGYIIDVSNYPNSNEARVGSGTALDNAVTRYSIRAVLNSTTRIGLNAQILGTSNYTSDNPQVSNTVPFAFNTSDAVTFNFSVPIVGWSASTSHTLTPSDTFSTDTAPLTYAGSATYTLSTLANAPIGTFITFTYAANTNTRTQTTTAPTQTTSDMNVNGIQIFTRAYNAASTAGNPAAIAIQIGKGLKGTSLGLYKSAGKVTAGSLDIGNPASTVQYGTYSSYNELTGILTVDGGYTSGTSTSHNLTFSDASEQSNGYLTINASKSAALTAVPTPLVAYLKDVKPSGTAGGTFTAGAWQTRTLNTLEGDTSFVTLSANAFTLPAGRYEIEASAPARGVNSHALKLRNITLGSDQLIGSNSYATSTGAVQTSVSIIGILHLTVPQVFEVQHRCETTSSSVGFGTSTGFGVSEVFTQVKIKKVG